MDLDNPILAGPGSPNKDHVVLEWLLWQRIQHNSDARPAYGGHYDRQLDLEI
jgi:hypothetical protein